MDAVTERPGLPLWSDYPRFVRRHRAAIGALMCLGLLVGFVWSLGAPTSYSATASVVLVPVPKYLTPSTTEIPPPEVTIDTDAQLLHSPAVLTAVGDVLGTAADAASDHLSVTASPNSHVLHITVSARSPRAAADAADAAVAAFVKVRRADLGALQADQLRQVRLTISGQQELLAEGVVVPAYDSLTAQVLELSNGLRELEEARRRPAEAIDAAVPPRHADRPNTEVPLTSGAMVGLLCACLLGAVRDRTGLLALRRLRHRFAPPPADDLPAGVHDHEDHHHVV
jgi:succinoglycan biosynthesis transport protein ExoP